jgi:hypothetical protein
MFYINKGVVFCWDINEMKMDFQIAGVKGEEVSCMYYYDDSLMITR